MLPRLRPVADHESRLKALLLYTTDFTMCWMDYFTGGNIDIRSVQVDSLSDEDVRILTLGSKMEWVTWYSYPTFICKWCPDTFRWQR